MTARMLSGEGPARAILERVRREAAALASQGIVPTLALVRAGDAPAASAYARSLARRAREAGVRVEDVVLPGDVSERALLEAVAELNADPAVHGILPQFPFPEGIDSARLVAAVAPEKDVDGLNPANLGKLVSGGAATGGYASLRKRPDLFLPATPEAAMELLSFYGIGVRGKVAAVIGAGRAGLPLGILLLREGLSEVVLIERDAPDPEGAARRADILFVAVGRPGLVTPAWVKPGAAVVDIGINTVMGPDGKPRIVGDVDPAVAGVAGAVAPVPGGVGPVTTAVLLEHLVRAARRLHRADTRR